MELELLEKIAQNTEPKESFQIIVADNKTKFTTTFNPHIELKANKRYEIALVNLETYYSFPNVTSENCRFTYSPDAGATWFDILIPDGCYEINDINEFIQLKMTQNGHDSSYITLSANSNTLKAVVILQNDYQVNFRSLDSICSVLGFNKDVYTADYQESEKPVNIMNINSILVNIDIISGSYINGRRNPTIYSFFPDGQPGYKIVETPANLVYLPITLNRIHRMLTTITDQNGNLLNLRGENVTIRFHVREI